MENRGKEKEMEETKTYLKLRMMGEYRNKFNDNNIKTTNELSYVSVELKRAIASLTLMGI